jgi:hypothetical protein
VPRRVGQKRFGYRNLTSDYKKRLARQGISQRDWENGVDLRKARGHTKDVASPKSALAPEVITSLVSGQGKAKDFAKVSRTRLPGWIPKDTRADVKAALSQLPSPNKWESVVLYPRGDGSTWTMKVTLKNMYHDVIEIEIPGGGDQLSGAWTVLDILSNPNNNNAWGSWDSNQLRIDRTGST